MGLTGGGADGRVTGDHPRDERKRPPDSWPMPLHPSVSDRLASLAPDQREAATARPVPCCASPRQGAARPRRSSRGSPGWSPPGSPPESIAAITFNRRAAVELSERVDAALAPLGLEAGAVRVRTFHALGLEILRDAGAADGQLVDRAAILAAVAPWADEAALVELDEVVSRLKIELGVTAAEVAADPDAGPLARAFVDYEAAVSASGGLDFDDLVLRAIEALDRDPPCSPAGAPGARTCSSTRSRTSTGRSFAWRSGSPSPPTGSCSSATTTSRSTAGGSPTSAASWTSGRICRASGGSTSR